MRKRPTPHDNNASSNASLGSGMKGSVVNSKSRRLYIGNVPYQAGLTDVALTQLFSALYVAGFGELKPGVPLPVLSFWLHADGKFGFMELRGEQETVNMMRFNQTVLHGRMLKVNRPTDFRVETHAPHVMNLKPDPINALGVTALCEKLDGIVNAPQPIHIQAAKQLEEEQHKQQHPYQEQNQNQQHHQPFDSSSSLTQKDRERDHKGHEDKEDLSKHNQAPDAMTDSDVNTNPNMNERYSANMEERNGIDPRERMDRDKDMNKTSNNHTHNHSNSHNNGSGSNDFVVISLQNLVSDDDLQTSEDDFSEIIDDVHHECSNYGEVVCVEIPRSGKFKGTAFVQFREHDGAVKAIEQLAERVFEGNKVIAIGIPEVSTAQQALNRN